MSQRLDVPARLGLAVLSGADAQDIAWVRTRLRDLAAHPADGAPALTFLTELDEQLAEVHAVLSGPGGARVVALAAHLSSAGLTFADSLMAARAILRP